MAQSMPMRGYRAPLWGSPDPLMRKAAMIAAAVGAGFLLAVVVAPDREVEITRVEQVPERFAKLILEEPKPPAPTVVAEAAKPAPPPITIEKPPAMVAPPTPKPAPTAVAKPTPPKTPARRAVDRPKVAADKGQAGRARAKQEVQQQLASVTTTLDAVVGELSGSLASTDDGKTTRKRSSRRRRPGAGRDAAQLAGVTGGLPSLPTDASGSALDATGPATGIAIEAIADVDWSEGGPGSGSPDAPGAGGPSEYRSDRSLLSVVRRYAPGIRYCYDNELKKHPDLGGKLLVAITVAASGAVTDAALVEDTTGSRALTSCALTQIEAWRFPEIPEGVVTFRAPFVFTPPE